jgi:CBS domain-containing protein
MPDRILRDVVREQRPVVVDSDITVAEAAKLMQQAKDGAAIITDGGKPVGIFTERDCLYRVAGAGKNPAEVTLGEVMTPNPCCVRAHRPFSDALYQMQHGGFRHLPVLDGKNIIGVVTHKHVFGSDLLQYEQEEVDRDHIEQIL